MYLVGTYEQFEEGFVPFFECDKRSEAEWIVERAKHYLSLMPAYSFMFNDEQLDKHMEECERLDSEFIKETGVNYKLSLRNTSIYEITIVEK